MKLAPVENGGLIAEELFVAFNYLAHLMPWLART